MSTTTLPKLELRPYQEEAIDAARSGITRLLVVLPLGRKKVVFAHLIAQREGRSPVLAHWDELIRCNLP
jgi:superfamily II DNA or RNA helicase